MPEASQAGAANLYISLPDAQTLAKHSAEIVNQIYLKISNAGKAESVAATLTQMLGEISTISEDSLVQVMGGIGKVSVRFSQVAALIGLAGGAMLGWFALSGLIAERRKEIGLMKAIGWKTNDMTKAFLLESMILSMLGGLIGVILGVIGGLMLTYIPLPDMSASMGIMHGMQETVSTKSDQKFPVQIDWVILILAVALSTIAGTFAGWNNSRRAAKIKPAQILR